MKIFHDGTGRCRAHSILTTRIRTFGIAILPVLAVAAGMMAGCGGGDIKVETRIDTDTADTAGPSDHSSDSPSPGTSRPDTSISSDTVPSGDRHGDSAAPASSANIRVSSPRSGDVIVGKSFRLAGESRTFESSANYRLRSLDGHELASGHFMATGEMGKFSPFSTEVKLRQPYKGNAKLEVFQFSAKDGAEIDKVILPLKFQTSAQSEETAVKVFFVNPEKGSGSSDCSKVFGVIRRIKQTEAIAQAALNEMLNGPAKDEKEEGFWSEIPNGTRLRKLVIEDGVATADFSAALKRSAGSCSVTAIRAQIERTLKQFPTVKEVVITVNGRKDGVLQP